MKKQFAAILTFFVCFAPPVLAGGFSVATDGPVIRLNEIVVVGADGLDLATGETGATVANGLGDLKADQTAAMPESKAGWSGNISFGSLFGDGRWAREVAARDDVAEITLAALLPSRDYGATVRQARYCISIPVATLKGASFEYRLGMHRSGRAKRTGKLTGDEAEGEFIATHIRHIQFTGGKVDLFVDFCPCGVWGIFLEDPATAYKAHLKRQGDQYVFVIPNRAARYGTRLVNKVVLRAGKHDMDRLHPVRAVHYTSPFPVFKRVQFVARFPVKGLSTRGNQPGFDQEFIPWQTQTWSAESGLGWIGAVQGKLIPPMDHLDQGPLFGGGLLGSGTAVFRLAHPSGRVLLNVMLSGAAGACEVSVRAGRGQARKVKVAANGRQTVTLPAIVHDGILDVQFDGAAWLLSAVSVQMLMAESEDYLYGRNWWAFDRPPWRQAQCADKSVWSVWPRNAFPKTSWPQ